VTHTPADCQATFISTTSHYDLQGVEASITYLLTWVSFHNPKLFCKISTFQHPFPTCVRSFVKLLPQETMFKMVNRAVSYNSFPLQLKLNPRQEFQIILSKADIQENVSITTNTDSA